MTLVLKAKEIDDVELTKIQEYAVVKKKIQKL